MGCSFGLEKGNKSTTEGFQSRSYSQGNRFFYKLGRENRGTSVDILSLLLSKRSLNKTSNLLHREHFVNLHTYRVSLVS